MSAQQTILIPQIMVDAADNVQPIPAANSLVEGVPPGAIGAANSVRTLDQVHELIRRYEDGLTSSVFPLSRLQFAEKRLLMDGLEFELNDAGVHRICGALGAPPSYLERLPLDLRDRNLEFGLERQGRSEFGLSDANSAVLSRNGSFVGFRRADLCLLSGTEIVDALREGLGECAQGLHVQNVAISKESFRLDVVSDRLRTDVRKGDVVQAGIHLEHSLLGEQATVVTAYLLRLVCSNGMTHRECVGSRRTKRTRRLDSTRADARHLQFEQVRSLVQDTRQNLTKTLAAIAALQNEMFDTVADVDKTFQHFLRRARMYSGNLMLLLQRAWREPHGGDQETSHFGILNALTWLATHPADLSLNNGQVYRLSDRQRWSLSNLAGVFATQRIHICPRCFSLSDGQRAA